MSKAQCLDCLDVIESTHRHDFVKCECGNSFIDGGNDYIRAGGRIVVLDGAKARNPEENNQLSKDVKLSDKEWFELHLSDMTNSDDFEEAMELAYTTGFADGQGESSETEYSEGYHNGKTAVEDRIKEVMNDPMYDGLSKAHLLGVLLGASLDGEWD